MASTTPSRSVSSSSLSTRRDTLTAKLSPAEEEKATRIGAACEDRDISALVNLATSTYGLVSDSVRRAACMFLYHLSCAAPDWLQGLFC